MQKKMPFGLSVRLKSFFAKAVPFVGATRLGWMGTSLCGTASPLTTHFARRSPPGQWRTGVTHSFKQTIVIREPV